MRESLSRPPKTDGRINNGGARPNSGARRDSEETTKPFTVRLLPKEIEVINSLRGEVSQSRFIAGLAEEEKLRRALRAKTKQRKSE